jgi:peptidoglycan/LPS O-acetylase OafA/YrhL
MGDDRSRARLTYAPALDGLRAIACLSVMLYHAHYLVGGFLGVDIFFTLSGFLITSLLLDELRAGDDIDLRAFWRRRVFRIVPLLATVSVTLFAWACVNGSDQAQKTIVGAAASLLFVVNWVVSHSVGAGGALTANWSVAMEEQFYLVWPLLLCLLYRWRSERALAWVVAGAAAALALHRFAVAPGWGVTRVWFGPDTQADALLAGCAVALGLRCRSRLAGRLALAGLAALLWFAVDSSLFTMRWLLPATVLCTAVIVPVLADHGGWLAWRPLRAIGRRSYGLYLWGTAINYLARDVYGVHGRALLLVVFPATFAVTEVTYRFVEVPLRRLGRRTPRRSPASAPAPAVPLQLSPGQP